MFAYGFAGGGGAFLSFVAGAVGLMRTNDEVAWYSGATPCAYEYPPNIVSAAIGTVR
jgi:hypothetical protein